MVPPKLNNSQPEHPMRNEEVLWLSSEIMIELYMHILDY
jgi:hypothetical protein